MRWSDLPEATEHSPSVFNCTRFVSLGECIVLLPRAGELLLERAAATAAMTMTYEENVTGRNCRSS